MVKLAAASLLMGAVGATDLSWAPPLWAEGSDSPLKDLATCAGLAPMLEELGALTFPEKPAGHLPGFGHSYSYGHSDDAILLQLRIQVLVYSSGFGYT